MSSILDEIRAEEEPGSGSNLRHLQHIMEGYRAFVRGDYDCPYSPGGARANSWQKGAAWAKSDYIVGTQDPYGGCMGDAFDENEEPGLAAAVKRIRESRMLASKIDWNAASPKDFEELELSDHGRVLKAKHLPTGEVVECSSQAYADWKANKLADKSKTP